MFWGCFGMHAHLWSQLDCRQPRLDLLMPLRVASRPRIRRLHFALPPLLILSSLLRRCVEPLRQALELAEGGAGSRQLCRQLSADVKCRFLQGRCRFRAVGKEKKQQRIVQKSMHGALGVAHAHLSILRFLSG
jgi:hypothetical protein